MRHMDFTEETLNKLERMSHLVSLKRLMEGEKFNLKQKRRLIKAGLVKIIHNYNSPDDFVLTDEGEILLSAPEIEL